MGYYSNIVIGYSHDTITNYRTGKTITMERKGVVSLAIFDLAGIFSRPFHPRNKEYFFTLCGDGNTRVIHDSYDEPIGVCSPSEFIQAAEEYLADYPDWSRLKICLTAVKSFFEIYGKDLVILHYGH